MLSNIHPRTPTWLRLSLVAALLVAFALRLTDLALQDIWWDEARNLDVALRPVSQIAGAPELDIQPPLYYYGLHAWLALTGMQRGVAPAGLAWFARVVSVFAGIAGVALVAALARRAGGYRAALAAGTIAAFSPFWLAESQETRMYTVAIALLSAAAYALMRSQSTPSGQQGQRFAWLAGFAALSTAALLTHYNAIFVLVAFYAWWTIVCLLSPQRWRRLLEPIATGFVTLLAILPIVPVALRQIPTYENPNLTVPTLIDYLGQNLQGHMGGYAWEPGAIFGYAPLWLASLLLAAGVGLIVAAVRGVPSVSPAARAQVRGDLSFLIVWFVGGLALYYLAVLDRGAFNIRYSSLVTPALLALLATGFAAWGRWLSTALVAVTILGMLPLIRADLTDPRFAREDMAGVVRWLSRNTSSGDVVLVDQKYPFGFYYERYSMDPGEPPVGPEAAPANYLFVDINTLDDTLNSLASDARRVFWVQWFESDTDPRHAVPFLLNQEGRHAGEQWFQGWSIDWWELNPPNSFDLDPGMRPLQAEFPPAVRTTEFSSPQSVLQGEPIPVAIRWQRLAGTIPARPLKARVAMYDDAGNRVAQADERILNDRHRSPDQWQEGESPLNVYLLQPPEDMDAGAYELRLLVYDSDTLEPLARVDANGMPSGQEAPLGEVNVELRP